MTIGLITILTPSKDNIRGASALPYHLLMERKKDVEVLIYSYNANGLSNEEIVSVEKELRLKMFLLPQPKWLTWMMNFHLLFLRVLLRYPFLNYMKLSNDWVEIIETNSPDLIWVYGEELSRVVRQFPNYRRIQIGPDVESLYYYRMLGQRFIMNSPLEYWRCALMYRKYARMERESCTDENFTYYAVGEEDVRHLQQLNPKVRARFLRHPHYNVNDNANVCFRYPKIKVLIAGQYNIYMKQEADLLVEQITVNANDNENYLREHYSITFLGKGWERHVEALRNVGYEVEHIKFAPDYIEEICKHDIQITPITIGTGTKGKVLDALANGLLVIGTPYALENIAVKHGESCVEYRHPQEVVEVLLDIPNNIQKYEAMAEEGRRQVLEHHNRAKIASELFGIKKPIVIVKVDYIVRI